MTRPTLPELQWLGIEYTLTINDAGNLARVSFTIDDEEILLTHISCGPLALHTYYEEVQLAIKRLAFNHLRSALKDMHAARTGVVQVKP